jgi:hypothetical protein
LPSSIRSFEDGRPSANHAGQEEIPMPQVADKMTKLRVPLLQMPVKFKKEFAGYQMVYHIGASEQSQIKLEDVELSDFSFDMKEGGTVLVVFNAYAKPNAADQGKIDQLMQLECEISLVPPDTTKQANLPLDGKAKRTTPKKKTAAEKVQEEGDPFANTDIPPFNPESEEQSEDAEQAE